MCASTGDPCEEEDDGLFCNGAEICDDELDACTHAGDPCSEGQECNEETDTCETLDEDDDSGVEDWPAMSKDGVARRLAERIADHIAAKS